MEYGDLYEWMFKLFVGTLVGMTAWWMKSTMGKVDTTLDEVRKTNGSIKRLDQWATDHSELDNIREHMNAENHGRIEGKLDAMLMRKRASD